jgi:phosphoribosylaminoimidazolecarboxamide formyltransferase / IMP cyclohydrolase
VIGRALISAYDKTGLDELGPGLAELGVELVASDGTAAFLESLGLKVTKVDELTEVPELLGGRVKTLHPNIHAGILARRDHPDDLDALSRRGIRPFDLVCVNLYPFTQIVGRYGVREEEAVEMIDIGGPSMLRGAAKNFAHVIPLCRRERFGEVLAQLREQGEVSLDTRRELAAEAFSATAAYEAAIASWFSDREVFPDRFVPSFVKVAELPYGENPHQRAAYYAEAGARRHLLSRVEQLHGKELSFNNLNDLSAARELLLEFTLAACVIVKHANPCGAAVAGTIEDAYERALAADPLSAYGGIVALNRPVPGALGVRIAEQFVEVLTAPGFEESAIEALRAKPATRILVDRERRRFDPGERDYKRVLGGMLIQDRDWGVEDRQGMEAVCGSPDETVWGDLLFAWRVCKHVSSNAIVLVKDLRTLGIGAGQMSRVDAVRLALEKAREHGHPLEGASLASDAFFPFADGPKAALDAGVTALIQPGGSKRDDEVVEAVRAAGAAMVFTHRRHFRH